MDSFLLRLPKMTGKKRKNQNENLHTAHTPFSKNTNREASGARRSKANNSGATQMYLDLGQKLFGASTKCSICSMVYLVDESEDQKRHSKFCKQTKENALPFVSKLKDYSLLVEYRQEVETNRTDKLSSCINVIIKATLDSALVQSVLALALADLGCSTDLIKDRDCILLYVCGNRAVACIVCEQVTFERCARISSAEDAASVMIAHAQPSHNDYPAKSLRDIYGPQLDRGSHVNKEKGGRASSLTPASISNATTSFQIPQSSGDLSMEIKPKKNNPTSSNQTTFSSNQPSTVDGSNNGSESSLPDSKAHGLSTSSCSCSKSETSTPVQCLPDASAPNFNDTAQQQVGNGTQPATRTGAGSVGAEDSTRTGAGLLGAKDSTRTGAGLLGANDSTFAESLQGESSAVGMMLGVKVVWVHAQYRRQGGGVRLLDTARRWCAFGTVVPKTRIAFSQPTEQGFLFAERYCGVGNVIAYA